MNANVHNCVDALKAEKKIIVEGYRGSWSVIDDLNGYVLLEHNAYGDETCYLVTKASDFIWKNFTNTKTNETRPLPYINGVVFETYDDIETCLEDEDII